MERFALDRELPNAYCVIRVDNTEEAAMLEQGGREHLQQEKGLSAHILHLVALDGCACAMGTSAGRSSV
ncbi:hypothetical protein NDU88_005404 [Pleurodeles waltl]|uniref:Uncharacterized protein n=1 Tax=Pleurodeles waltl TaxID=8319 RepID=A0AAV7RN72_PLEWA|nr:hypothetical protein NDU88_005404 [Pleurodeles waltl]